MQELVLPFTGCQVQLYPWALWGVAVAFVVHSQSLYFPAKDHVVREISKTLAEHQTFLLDFTQVEDIDHTIAVGISGLVKEIRKSCKTVLVCGANRDVTRVLHSVCSEDLPLYVSLEHALRETNC